MELNLDDSALRVLRTLAAQPRSRSDVMAATGWSRNTVAARLDELVQRGWALASDSPQGERGRPSLLYRVNPRRLVVYVAGFGRDQLHGALCGLDGEVLASDLVPLQIDNLPDALAASVSQLRRLTTDLGDAAPPASFAVIGGPSAVANPMSLSGWSANVAMLPDAFSRALGVDVLVENDANLIALGLRRGLPGVRDFIFLKVASGIGAGIVLDGRLHAGVAGLAGEVGHIPVARGGDAQCACGNRGCVSNVASAPAIMRRLSSDVRPVTTVDELQLLVAQGDPDAVAALRTAGRDIGEALVGVVTGIAPELVVLGGAVTQLGDHLATGVREALTSGVLPALSSRIRVTTTPEHREASLRGAAELAVDWLLTPDDVRRA